MIDLSYYNEHRGIYSPLIEHNGIVCGFWMVGNDYRNGTSYYGAYPPSYLKRLSLLFPRPDKVLHLFSGKVKTGAWDHLGGPVPEEETFDINPDLDPSHCGNAEHLRDICGAGAFDLILADPPYGNNHEKYGTAKVNKKKVVSACAEVLEPEGYLVWLDTIMPIWAKRNGWKLRGTIGLLQSTNHVVRVITVLEKQERGT